MEFDDPFEFEIDRRRFIPRGIGWVAFNPKPNVRPGYTGSVQISIPGNSIALLVLRVKTANARESIDNHDTVGTGSPTNSALTGTGVGVTPNAYGTQIQGKTRLRLSIGGQYSAGGTGDPPQFGNGGVYGTIGVLAQIGDTFSLDGGNSLPYAATVEDLANSLNESGTIDYDLSILSNGPFVRSTVAIGG
jgi:hypothetical protein